MSKQLDNFEEVFLERLRFGTGWTYVIIQVTALLCAVVTINTDCYHWNLSSSFRFFEDVVLECNCTAEQISADICHVRPECTTGNTWGGPRFRAEDQSPLQREACPEWPVLASHWAPGLAGATLTPKSVHLSTCPPPHPLSFHRKQRNPRWQSLSQNQMSVKVRCSKRSLF